MAGLELTGFEPASLAEIKAILEADFKAKYGQNTRVDAQSVNGQLIGIMAERFAELWSATEDVYASGFLSGAAGSALDDLVALANVTRQAATSSTVVLDLTGTAATLVPAGSQVSASSSGSVWITDVDVTLTGGIDTVAATAQNTGPILALTGTINTIDTPVAGWDTVSHSVDAVPGTNLESDAALRTRFQTSFFVTQAGSLGAIRNALLRITDVLEANILENVSDVVDANGLPGHSFEAVVRGGLDQAIVDVLGLNKPAGIETFGSTSGTFTDSLGNPHTINFTRPTDVDIYIEVDYTPISGVFPSDGEAQITTALTNYGDTLIIGDDIIPFQLVQQIEVIGIQDLELRVGLSALNVFDIPIPITFRQLADIDSSRIVYTVI